MNSSIVTSMIQALTLPTKPPKPQYADPAELVSKSKAKAQAGTVETWSISEVDKKGKKKKGTLGVGNGAMFFASESDKVRALHSHHLVALAGATLLLDSDLTTVSRRPRCRNGRPPTFSLRASRRTSTFT